MNPQKEHLNTLLAHKVKPMYSPYWREVHFSTNRHKVNNFKFFGTVMKYYMQKCSNIFGDYSENLGSYAFGVLNMSTKEHYVLKY